MSYILSWNYSILTSIGKIILLNIIYTIQALLTPPLQIVEQISPMNYFIMNFMIFVTVGQYLYIISTYRIYQKSRHYYYVPFLHRQFSNFHLANFAFGAFSPPPYFRPRIYYLCL